jgi:hypothetical protein
MGPKPDYLVAAEAAAAAPEAAMAAPEAALAAPAAAAAAAPASEAAAAGAGAGAGAAAGAGAGAGAGSSFLPQAASAAAAIRVARTSDFFISEFLLWEKKKQFPEIVRAAGMAALTEQQGLELLLFSPKLYAEKNKAGNPR